MQTGDGDRIHRDGAERSPAREPPHLIKVPRQAPVRPWSKRRLAIVVACIAVGTTLAGAYVLMTDDTLWLRPVSPARVVLDLNATVEPRTVDSATYWDSTLVIMKMTPGDERLAWADARVSASASWGVLLTPTAPAPDDPAGYDDGSDGKVDVEVWYVDAGKAGWLDKGDAIKLTGLTVAFENATFEMSVGGVEMTLRFVGARPFEFG